MTTCPNPREHYRVEMLPTAGKRAADDLANLLAERLANGWRLTYTIPTTATSLVANLGIFEHEHEHGVA